MTPLCQITFVVLLISVVNVDLFLRPYYTVQLIALTNATELQQLSSAQLHTGNLYSVGCCRGRVLYWECET